MKESKDHLNIDLEFLDKKESVRVAPKKPEPPKRNEPNWRFYNPNNVNSKSDKQYKWKNILIVGGIIVFIGWAIFSDSGSSSSTSNNSYIPSTNNVRNGQYSCSSYNSSQADSLNPTESESTLSFAQTAMSNRSDELDRMKNEIDSSYVNDNSSQYEIGNYNEQVATYNTKLASYKRDVASLSTRIDQFNGQIERHNNYLIAHCTKAY